MRGNALGLGELRKKEGGNVFGGGTRTTVAISILVRDGSDSHEIHYHDIGDYLSQKEKLSIIEDFADISAIDWQEITPDANNDWLNQRDPNYQNYISLFGESNSIFYTTTLGVTTNRDAWTYGFNRNVLKNKVSRLIENYSANIEQLKKFPIDARQSHLNRNPEEINWTRKLERFAKQLKEIKFDENHLRLALYRPYVKKWLYHDKFLNEETRQYYTKFGNENIAITTTGRGSSKEFSALVSDCVSDLQSLMNCQGFMRYDNEVDETQLFQSNDNVNQAFADKLGLSLDDTFAYVYGLLNSREYQEKYANDLKKDLARIPIVKNKEKYVEVGKALMDLHLNYEEVPVYKGVDIQLSEQTSYKVTKMKFAKKRDENGKSVNDRSTIIYNNDITISNIPEKAYRYVVNGRSAIEWIMDQYQIKTDKKSGITDDPNDYSNDEKYIFNLLLRIINVSIQTVDLINSLPEFEVEE